MVGSADGDEPYFWCINQAKGRTIMNVRTVGVGLAAGGYFMVHGVSSQGQTPSSRRASSASWYGIQQKLKCGGTADAN